MNLTRVNAIAALVALITAVPLHAHDLPAQLPEPQSPAEAWNVIKESTANVDTLMQQGLLRAVTFQIANAGSAIKYLGGQPTGATDAAAAKQLADRLLAGGSDLLVAIRDRTLPFPAIRQNWLAWRKVLAGLEAQYSPDTVHAAV